MDIGLMVVAQEVEGELAGQGEDTGIAADATGVLVQAFVKDVVEAVLDAPVCADVLAQGLRRASARGEVVGRFLLAPDEVFAGGVEAFSQAMDLDRHLKVVVPGLRAGAWR